MKEEAYPFSGFAQDGVRFNPATQYGSSTVPLCYRSTAELLAMIGERASGESLTKLRSSLPEDSPLKVAFELVARWHEEKLDRGEAFTVPRLVREFLEIHLRNLRNEAFAVLFLDNKHRKLSFEIMFRGTVDGASVHPRVIVQRALELNATAIILAHNHPAGDAEPSRSDHAITKKIQQACELFGIRILDHFVIANGDVCSFSERGWL